MGITQWSIFFWHSTPLIEQNYYRDSNKKKLKKKKVRSQIYNGSGYFLKWFLFENILN
jgi:hypothetical protein